MAHFRGTDVPGGARERHPYRSPAAAVPSEGCETGHRDHRIESGRGGAGRLLSQGHRPAVSAYLRATGAALPVHVCRGQPARHQRELLAGVHPPETEPRRGGKRHSAVESRLLEGIGVRPAASCPREAYGRHTQPGRRRQPRTRRPDAVHDRGHRFGAVRAVRQAQARAARRAHRGRGGWPGSRIQYAPGGHHLRS